MSSRREEHPASGFLLDAENVDSLRTQVARLRRTGLSNQEAAAELVRENIYDWMDSECDSGAVRRLRSV